MNYKEVEGNLIFLARSGAFDVIAHGCNCFCTQKAGIAVQMVKAFGTDSYPMENTGVGDINKLGQIDWRYSYIGTPDELPNSIAETDKKVAVVNCYTQYHYSAKLKPFDYEAFALCMRKLNQIFSGKHIGLPMIGAGLAGGDAERIKAMMKAELQDCQVTLVLYKI